MIRIDILDRKEDILNWIEERQPKCWIAAQLNCKIDTLNRYLKQMDIQYSGQQNKKGQLKGTNNYMDSSNYLYNGSTISSHRLKLKLIREGIKEDKCEMCGVSTWLGQPLRLELHHKDGNHYNNELSNLEVLCPNCHSLTEHYNQRKS